MRLDFGKRDRCGREDAALRSAASELGHRQKRLACQRRSDIEAGAAAVREQERADAGAAIFGDALWERQPDERADADVAARAETFPPPLRGRERGSPSRLRDGDLGEGGIFISK